MASYITIFMPSFYEETSCVLPQEVVDADTVNDYQSLKTTVLALLYTQPEVLHVQHKLIIIYYFKIKFFILK
jgi:hypothetical protein